MDRTTVLHQGFYGTCWFVSVLNVLLASGVFGDYPVRNKAQLWLNNPHSIASTCSLILSRHSCINRKEWKAAFMNYANKLKSMKLDGSIQENTYNVQNHNDYLHENTDFMERSILKEYYGYNDFSNNKDEFPDMTDNIHIGYFTHYILYKIFVKFNFHPDWVRHVICFKKMNEPTIRYTRVLADYIRTYLPDAELLPNANQRKSDWIAKHIPNVLLFTPLLDVQSMRNVIQHKNVEVMKLPQLPPSYIGNVIALFHTCNGRVYCITYTLRAAILKNIDFSENFYANQTNQTGHYLAAYVDDNQIEYILNSKYDTNFVQCQKQNINWRTRNTGQFIVEKNQIDTREIENALLRDYIVNSGRPSDCYIYTLDEVEPVVDKNTFIYNLNGIVNNFIYLRSEIVKVSVEFSQHATELHQHIPLNIQHIVNTYIYPYIFLLFNANIIVRVRQVDTINVMQQGIQNYKIHFHSQKRNPDPNPNNKYKEDAEISMMLEKILPYDFKIMNTDFSVILFTDLMGADVAKYGGLNKKTKTKTSRSRK